jgi:hypothetical protein
MMMIVPSRLLVMNFSWSVWKQWVRKGEGSKSMPLSPAELPKKRRAKKNIDPMDVKSFTHSTRLNKDQDGFKVPGVASVGHEDVPHYVGSFDRDDARAPLPCCPRTTSKPLGLAS